MVKKRGEGRCPESQSGECKEEFVAEKKFGLGSRTVCFGSQDQSKIFGSRNRRAPTNYH
jgi:hypothetical protein